MGCHLNPRPTLFQISLNSEPFVDKSMLIDRLNHCVCKDNCSVCLTRPRRFGKTRALNMLAAYYGKTDSAHLFENLKIRQCPSFEQHLNKYNVIKLDMLDYFGKSKNPEEWKENLAGTLFREFRKEFPSVEFTDASDLESLFLDIYGETGELFVILIDEWDAVFRNYPDEKALQQQFLDFLRGWLKDRDYIALVYMTGILPIKKYGTHSALNMFSEYSIVDPGILAPYFGFTEEEVDNLCRKYGKDFSEMKSWYDGYELSYVDEGSDEIRLPIYNPKSVVDAINRGRCDSYWTQTESFEALEIYFRYNFDGLKDDILKLFVGETLDVDLGGFSNSMTDFYDKNDIFAILVHLGYLTFNRSNGSVGKVRIPNNELTKEFNTAMRKSEKFKGLKKELESSAKLLSAICACEEEVVANSLEEYHLSTSVLDYNGEAALKYTILLALRTATLDYYDTVQELPAGKGYADIAYIPKPGVQKPALLMELKWNGDAESAISQIKEKNYPRALESYRGNLILCGVNYDRESKKHTCRIELWDCR